MQAAFLMRSAEPDAQPTATRPTLTLPRSVRKALRVTTPKRADNTVHTDLTEFFRTEYRRDAYHNSNLYTMDYDSDEFNDIDDELDGLTIVECSGDAELFEFCTGYNVE